MVLAHRAVLGMCVEVVTVLLAVVVLTDVVTAGCDTGALLVDGQELDKL